MADLTDILERFGLRQREIQVYLNALENKSVRPSQVSRHTGIPRSSVHLILSDLAEKGFLKRVIKKDGAEFTSDDPEAVFSTLLSKEKHSLQAREKQLPQLLSFLSAFYQQNSYRKPDIEFIEGKQEINEFLHRSLQSWFNAIRNDDNTWWGFQDYQFIHQYRDWVEYYWREKPEDQIVKIFSDRDVPEGKNIPNRHVCLLPSEGLFKSNLWVCADFLIVIANQNRPHYGFQIRDPLLSENLKIVFSLLWKALNKR